MSAFTGPLTITEHAVDSDFWSLVSPLAWEVSHGVFITVPPGFTSDGASIPWPVNVVFPRWGREYRRPAVLHDYLCSMLRAGTPDPNAPTQMKADKLFRKAMGACRVSWLVRWSFFLAVRAFSLFRRH